MGPVPPRVSPPPGRKGRILVDPLARGNVAIGLFVLAGFAFAIAGLGGLGDRLPGLPYPLDAGRRVVGSFAAACACASVGVRLRRGIGREDRWNLPTTAGAALFVAAALLVARETDTRTTFAAFGLGQLAALALGLESSYWSKEAPSQDGRGVSAPDPEGSG